MRTMASVLLILSLLLSSCQPITAETNSDPLNPNSEAARPSEVQSMPTSDPEVDSPTEADLNTPVPEIIKTYHMNKVYDIVPNEPEGDARIVLLTFDDGPKERGMIEAMLETLDRYEARAIFFVNGYRVKQNPELLQLLYDRGQVIGNHAWDHIVLSKLTDEQIDHQVMDVQDIVQELTGSAPTFFRPPHGAGNDHLKQRIKEENMLYMTWSNGSLDWDPINKDNPQGVIGSVMEQLRPGSNILMHELPWTVEALDELLGKLRAEGYSFVDPNAIELEMR